MRTKSKSERSVSRSCVRVRSRLCSSVESQCSLDCILEVARSLSLLCLATRPARRPFSSARLLESSEISYIGALSTLSETLEL